MLEQLVKRLELEQTLDEMLLSNLQKLVEDFYQKELTESELSKILTFSIGTDAYLESRNIDLSENDGMWENINERITKVQSENLVYVFKVLSGKKAYRRLGKLQAYVLQVAKKENMERFVTRFFTGYWGDAPDESKKFFDPVIAEAAKVYRNAEDESKKYMDAMNLFLSVQEMGKGTIWGSGCNELINIIESNTSLTDKKQFQINKKKKDDGLWDTKLTKCAFEAFNYTQRNHLDISISKIRLQHLARCIVKAYEEGVSMTKSKALNIYSEYPVVVDGISDEELQTFFELLADVTSLADTSREEYKLLFNFWKLSDVQKELLICIFAEVEFDYFKKEKTYTGIEEILGAAIDIADSGYDAAFKVYASGLKHSFKEKITETLKTKSDREIRNYWNQISKEDEKGDKKGFFKFGRRS